MPSCCIPTRLIVVRCPRLPKQTFIFMFLLAIGSVMLPKKRQQGECGGDVRNGWGNTAVEFQKIMSLNVKCSLVSSSKGVLKDIKQAAETSGR